MLKLAQSSGGEIVIHPRWPSKYVFITENAYSQLRQAQMHLLPHNIKLALTRGYENEGPILKYLRRFMRWIGGVIFCVIYPERSHEWRAIFCPNGHDTFGDCIDVNVICDDRILNFLPYGVFTSKHVISAIRRNNASILNMVWRALEAAGFSIHSNETEAMQIHCELLSSRDSVLLAPTLTPTKI